MRPLYHLVAPADWDSASSAPYRPASLDAEGFVHCSYAEQVAPVADRFYADCPELLVLTLDPARLTSPVRDEDGGTGELFPHVYGPIDRAAVVAVAPLRRGADGRWVFAE